MIDNKNEIRQLADKYFHDLSVRVDIDVLFPQLNKYCLTTSRLEDLFISISKNISFFQRELNYPLQLSNLLFFEIDARSEPQENCRGTEYRHMLTRKYREILDSQNAK
jgi:hypothetical protein